MSNETTLDSANDLPAHPLLVQIPGERISELEEDIRHLRRRQLAIERNNRLFEALLASSHDGIALTRLDGTLIRIVRSIVGYGSTELTGTSIFDLVHTDDRESMRELYSILTGGVGQRLAHQTRLLCPDGSFAWVDGTISDMIDNPAVQAIVHNYRNISLSKAAELTFAELAAVIRYAPFATFSKSLTGEILSWNDGAEEMFGYRHDDIVGRHVSLLIPADRRAEEEHYWALVIRLKAPSPRIRTVRVRKNGAVLPIELVLAPLLTGPIIHGVAHLSYAVPPSNGPEHGD